MGFWDSSSKAARYSWTHKRLDDVLADLYFSLARQPEVFPAISDTSLSVAKTAVYPDVPSHRIFFTYDDTEVHLLVIEFAEEFLPEGRHVTREV